MKPENKVRLILIAPAVITIIILSGCFNNKKNKQDNKKVNTTKTTQIKTKK
ncbi:hypothetical protein KAT08_03790 [Candidatus Babeliales bacterium]|nr:hypothetical protein [Candidatus Babeliales bacterium]